VTCCVIDRRVVFVDQAVVDSLRLQIFQSCQRKEFALLAYVFMPDHLHLLVEGTSERAEFRALMQNVRKRTAMCYRNLAWADLWQDGYFERVLRRDEDTQAVIDYILANPVRAELVEKAVDYPFSWAVTLDAAPDAASTPGRATTTSS